MILISYLLVVLNEWIQKSKLEKQKTIGKNNVNARRRGDFDSESVTTLEDDRFDARTRDEIRRDIESLLKNNFRIKSDNQRKNNILKYARENAKASKTDSSRMMGKKKNKKNPFNIKNNIKDSSTNLVSQYEKDGIKTRMKRRIVRRRSQYNFEAGLAQAYLKDKNQRDSKNKGEMDDSEFDPSKPKNQRQQNKRPNLVKKAI